MTKLLRHFSFINQTKFKVDSEILLIFVLETKWNLTIFLSDLNEFILKVIKKLKYNLAQLQT